MICERCWFETLNNKRDIILNTLESHLSSHDITDTNTILSGLQFDIEEILVVKDIGFDIAHAVVPHSFTNDDFWIHFVEMSPTIEIMIAFILLALETLLQMQQKHTKIHPKLTISHNPYDANIITNTPLLKVLIICKRVFFLLGLLSLLRGLMIQLTQLPVPPKDYKIYDKRLVDTDVNIFCGAWLIFSRQTMTWTDMFFSGHTTSLTLFALIIHDYIGNGCSNVVAIVVVCKVLNWIFVFFIIFVMLAFDYHYSIDIICGMLFTICFWKIYHLYLLKNREEQNTFVKWFECDPHCNKSD